MLAVPHIPCLNRFSAQLESLTASHVSIEWSVEGRAVKDGTFPANTRCKFNLTSYLEVI